MVVWQVEGYMFLATALAAVLAAAPPHSMGLWRLA
jgi:hypothetical protein